jgi:serine/threonine protein kinase
MHSGHRLSEIIAAGPLETDRLLAIGAALADIVATAHADAKVFGALAPTTVFVTDQGSVRVLDAAQAPISARREDDLLALGTLLYEMATGVAPYGAAGRGDNRGEAPPSPIEYNPRLPSGLVQLIRRGVHPDAVKRFGSADEIIEMLREVQRAPGSLESLLPTEHVSSSAGVKPPPRPPLDVRDREDDSEDGRDDRERDG